MLEILTTNTIIYCKQWTRTREFYGEVLGLEERFRKDDWFVEYTLFNGSCLSIADAARCTVKPSGGAGLTLSFQIENLMALFVFLKGKQVEPTPIRENSWRAPFFFIRDPENTRIEFWTLQRNNLRKAG